MTPRLTTPPRLVATALCCAMSVSAVAGANADEQKRSYNLPSGDAATTLNRFAGASGQQIIFMMDKVKGERTNAVAGDYAARDALDRMLAGTGLSATRDPVTGAFVVSRKAPKGEVGPVSDPQPKPKTTPMKLPLTRRTAALFAGWLASIAAAEAQTASSAPGPSETVKLSPFEVIAESEPGYRAANSVTASRFALPIMDTPMSIAVVTEEFLRDIGARDALDSLSYVSGITQGNSPVRLEGSNSFNIRGVATGFMLRNGVTSYGINDGYNIERWEVLKGIVGMMYGDRNLGGVVNSVSAQPKSKFAAEVYTRFDDEDSWRVTGRVTGPLNKDRTLLFMVNAMKKDEGTFMKDERLAAEGFTGSLIYKPFDRTKLFVEYEYYNQHNTLATKLPPYQFAAGPRANNDRNWWERVGFAPVPLDFSYSGSETYLNEINRVINLTLDQKLLGWLDYRSNFIYSKRAQDRLNRDAGPTYTTVAPGTARSYFDYATGQVKTETAADSPYIINGMNSNLREFKNWNTLWRNDLLANYNLVGGKHRTMVGFEYQERSGDFKSFDSRGPVSLDGRYGFTPQLRAFAGNNPRPNTDIRTFNPGLPLPSRTEFYASAMNDPTDQNGNFFGSTNETRAYYAVHYSQFFRERLTLFAGIRKDKDRNKENFNRRDFVVLRPNGQPRNNPVGTKVFDTGRPTVWRQRNSPQAGVAFRILKDLSVYASYSDVLVAYNDAGTAAFQERLVRDAAGVWSVGPDTFSHPPQTGSNKEIGFKSEFLGGRLSGTLAFFQTELINKQYTVSRDDPSNITLAPGAPAGTLAPLAYANLGGLERYRGVELDFVYNVNKELRFLGSYAYTEAGIIKDSATRTDPTSPAGTVGGTPPATVKRTEGQQAPSVPEHQWRLWANYRFSATEGFLKTVGLGLGVRYYGPAVAGADNYRNAVVLDTAIVDLSLSRKFRIFERDISTTLRAQNLLDERYYGTRQIYGDPRLFVLELRHYF